ncbi:protein PHYTOCHROME-DEPENDENT LATE-FLOWERING-like isoform X1 [Phoenix dactylifera]|uniref:Protein PHYTOCHROME-DEPENDENT LATE-FLOWERING-like isoform X1 n=1 Tax=Phoenix dactylifera TaxID=42345 RepID=A0A8B7BPX4_PHODC|nr:protein PHYTOCHROME-DEPENDENT LATE-FLOWERING-like isoform X1 [Phoenix dactylifera]
MGVSFKVSKIGIRYRPKPSTVPEEPGLSSESSRDLIGAGSKREVDIAEAVNDANGASVSSACSGGLVLPEHEVSFTLNLYQKGYIIGKPNEAETCQTETFQPLLQDFKSLHPYDRASETLFSAIESGWLPGDLLDDIPSKYIDGTLVCEVRDYRKCISESGSAVDGFPIVNKVRLRMSLENIIKDISLISDDSWTYSDLMEVESRIVKALQPQLCLDPTPRLDRLCKSPTSSKLNLGIERRKRLRQTPEVTVTSNNQTHGKKVCIDRLQENANCRSGDQGTLLGNATMQQIHENMAKQNVPSGVTSLRSNNFAQETVRPSLSLPSQSKFQPAGNYPAVVHDRGSGPPMSFAGVNTTMPSSQNLMGSYTDNINSNAPHSMKRENQDAQSTSLLDMKRRKQTPIGLDGIQQQQPGAQLVAPNGPDMPWKNQPLHPRLDVVNGMQYSSTVGGQRYASPMINNIPNQEAGSSFYFNQQAMRYGAKEEQIDTEKRDRQELERSKDALQTLISQNSTGDQHQSRSQNLLQQESMRNHLPALTQWHNARQLAEKDMKKDDMHQKRKSVPSPRVSSAPMVQSPMSSRSGEISSGSVGGQFSAVATTSALGSQKDKVAANSNPAVGAPSMTSSPGGSVHWQHQASVAGKCKTNSVPKTQAMSGVGSPASVSNMNVPLNANSPSIGTAPMCDQIILERFAKIEIITQRYHLNLKKNKVDDCPARKPVTHANQKVATCLSDSLNVENFRDPIRPMSRSVLGGTINTCKTRTICFVRAEHMYQAVPPRAHYRMTLTEKPYDGTVAMHYGDIDESDFPNTQEFVTLPTTHYADLLAAQFCAQMERDGYQIAEDHIQPIPMRMVAPSSSMTTIPGMASDNAAAEVKHPEVAPGPPSHVAAQANANVMGPLNAAQNLPNSAQMLASANNSQALQGYLPGAAMPARTQQLDQTLLQQQQQQQQQLQQNVQSQMQQQQLPLPHIQRSSSLLSTNALSQLMGQNSNLQIGNNPMVNSKQTALQLQMLQQQAQQQQQQQSQLPRKVMMGLGPAMNMGNMGNNMMSLSGLSNVMGMGGVRGISSPMGPMSGLGNVSPNQLNLGSASNFGAGHRTGSISHAQAAAMASKLRMVQQNRTGMYGPQSGIAGMAGNNNQMLSSSAGLSMLGHALNRANVSPLHRNVMSPMGPPKIPGTNFYLNPQQQLQLQHQQQQQQLQQQQLQQQHPQQLQQQQHHHQQISSPLQQAQVGSPPVVGSPQAMIMQQQQISPQQMGQQPAMSPQQLSSGALQQINNCGNAGAGPASPQLSSQTHGSVGSITSSPMEQLQGANKGGSVTNV